MKPLCPDFPMPIITDRLIIRPIQIGDGKMINEAVLESFAELNYFMDWAKEKPSLAESEAYARYAAENWISKKNDEPYLQLIILDKSTQEMIGATGYHHYNWEIPSVETGYWIRTSQSGKGLMAEAINAITQYAFKQLKVKRIVITCDPDNIKSKNIPEKLGYTLEGRLKNHRIKSHNGEVGDTLVYAKYDLSHLPLLHIAWNKESEDKISFRALSLSDISLMHQWFNRPHVQAFYSLRTWSEKEVEAKLRPYITAEKPVIGFIILINNEPIGYIQSYKVSDYPWENQNLSKDLIENSAGMDLFIGQKNKIGKGLGEMIIKRFLEDKVWPTFDYCVVDPDINNIAAIRCYRKLQFIDHELLETKNALGQPVKLQLMILDKNHFLQ